MAIDRKPTVGSWGSVTATLWFFESKTLSGDWLKGISLESGRHLAWPSTEWVAAPKRLALTIPESSNEGAISLVTLTNLRSQSSKELAQLARNNGVSGWSSMRKEQLVKAIMKTLKKRDKAIGSSRSAPIPKSSTTPKSPGSKRPKPATPSLSIGKPKKNWDIERSAIAAKLKKESAERERLKDLALAASLQKDQRIIEKDRLVLVVRDSYWLQAYWEITPATIRRAKSALEKNWRGAKPVLRLAELVEENDQLTERVVREIPIHGGVDTWYIDTISPPKTYRASIGYLFSNGKFYSLCRSNRVSTPSPNAKGQSSHWADIAADCENIFAMSGGYDPLAENRDLQEVFEEKLKRPMIALGPNHAALLDHNLEFPFEVDAQMVIYGVASPGASVTLAGEPVKVDPDGNFSIRMEFPDKRQVLPVVACSRDGSQQRTTVLAIERNTKVMEAINIESDDP